MSASFQRKARLAETQAGIDHFVNGFERVEVLDGGIVRLVSYVSRPEEGRIVRSPCEHTIVMPMASILDLAAKLIAAAGQPVTVDESGKIILLQ